LIFKIKLDQKLKLTQMKRFNYSIFNDINTYQVLINCLSLMPYNEEQIIDMFNINIKSLDRKLKLKK